MPIGQIMLKEAGPVTNGTRADQFFGKEFVSEHNDFM